MLSRNARKTGLIPLLCGITGTGQQQSELDGTHQIPLKMGFIKNGRKASD